LIPFYIVVLLAISIDPYGYFNCNFIPQDIKEKALRMNKETMVYNVALSKMIHYKRIRSPFIIIGDSRSQWLRQDIISKCGGHKYFNFGVPGFNYPDIYKTAIYCMKLADVKEIIWGCGFHNFNDAWGLDRSIFDEAYTTMSKPLSFLYNKTLLQSVLNTIRCSYKAWKWKTSSPAGMKKITDYDQSKNLPDLITAQNRTFKNNDLIDCINPDDYNDTTTQCNRTEQWIDDLAKRDQHLKNFKYPKKIVQQLDSLGDLCTNKRIDLTFIVFPNHVDYQYEIITNKRYDLKLRFLRDLNSNGNLFYFDYPNEVTKNRCDYSDEFHLTKNAYELITTQIWSDTKIGYYYKKDSFFLKNK
jgi:hypothetical protein